MPWFKTHKKQKSGKPIEARTLADMARTCDWIARLQVEPPLSILSVGGGPLLRWAGMIFGVYIGITNGTITARSGSTPGSGRVDFQAWNGTTLQSMGTHQTCYNISSSSGGIVTGKYCIVLKISGVYWIITTEC